MCPIARLHVLDPTDSVFVTSPLVRKLWGVNPKQTTKKRALNFIVSGSELKTIVSPAMGALDSYNLFNGSGEFDMAPKEKMKVNFTPDTAPRSPELHGCLGQGKIELGDAKPVLLPLQRVSPLDTENTNASQSHPAPEYDYSTPRLRRNSVSERDLVGQVSVTLGQPYAAKPKPAIRKPAESAPPDIELGVEAGPSRHQNSTEHRATLDAHERLPPHTSDLQD